MVNREAALPPQHPAPPLPEVADWPLLPWILGAVGAAAGLAAFLLLDGQGAEVPWRAGLAALVLFGALAIGFTLDRAQVAASCVFSALVGLVPGGLAFHFVRADDRLAGTQYAFAAGVLACALALPLFQAGFPRTRFATPYRRIHFHVWTDAVSAGGAGAFAVLSFAMLWLVDGLLGLVGYHGLRDLISNHGLAPAWLAGSFGAALGVLRNNIRAIGALQGVALLVLALLAVPLALALLVFLALLIVSGGEALWEATDSATPVLLACAAGCWVLANAVIRDEDAARSRNRVMQAAALVLALGILPLAVFAAISMGLRIDQHGLAPERLWALVAIGVAVAFGLAYLVAVLRRWVGGWAEQLRAANLRLAAGVCVLALLLALPLLDFGAISASNQVARLESGRVSIDRFDYSALRWDFGEAGRGALARLTARGGEAGRRAREALAQRERPPMFLADGAREQERRANLRVRTDDPAWERRIRDHFANLAWECLKPCVAIDLGEGENGTRHVKLVEGNEVGDWMIEQDAADATAPGPHPEKTLKPEATPGDLTADSEVELRPFEGRQIYVDGKPVGEPFR